MSVFDVSTVSMGATAATITSMGVVAGLQQGDGARAGVVTGLLVVAIADNVSDSLGIHIYKESEGASGQEIRSSTVGNFLTRLVLAVSFVAIVMLSPSHTAFIVSSIWGCVLLAVLSVLIAKRRKAQPLREVVRHLMIALLVIASCKLLGNIILRIVDHSGL